MPKSYDLIILNYAMDSNSQLLSHQRDVVIALASKFQKILVVTSAEGTDYLPENVSVLNLNWKQGKTLHNIFHFYKAVVPILFRHTGVPVFSHMTQIQSMLIGPLTLILKSKHILWYAHKHYPLSLRIANFFVDIIVTSTSGSCPIRGSKVITIGQAVDVLNFAPKKFNHKLSSLIHVGRLDKSKNIEQIIHVAHELRLKGYEISLDLIGAVASKESNDWIVNLRANAQSFVNEGWLEFKDPIPRSKIANELRSHDLFVHAYLGSLDKTLIEATLVGLPVITTNQEYVQIFGSWSKSSEISLQNEYDAIWDLESRILEKEIERRRLIALSEHSFDSWIEKLSTIIHAK